MAIHYGLEIATSLTSHAVTQALVDIGQSEEIFDASINAETVINDGAVGRRGTWIYLIDKIAPPYSPVITELGIIATARLGFRMGAGKIRDQDPDIARLTLGLLDRLPGDAVLHREIEQIWLLRQGDDLTIDEGDGFWTPETLSLLTHPFKLATRRFS